jgi:5-methylcytosine-specific restriction protein A
MPIRLCYEPDCRNVATYRGRCAKHAARHDHAVARSGYRLYRTKRWRNTRAAQLRRHPLCQCPDPSCELIATDVDHLVAIADGGDPWNPANLQSLTRECHARKTRVEQLAREVVE